MSGITGLSGSEIRPSDEEAVAERSMRSGATMGSLRRVAILAAAVVCVGLAAGSAGPHVAANGGNQDCDAPPGQMERSGGHPVHFMWVDTENVVTVVLEGPAVVEYPIAVEVVARKEDNTDVPFFVAVPRGASSAAVELGFRPIRVTARSYALVLGRDDDPPTPIGAAVRAAVIEATQFDLAKQVDPGAVASAVHDRRSDRLLITLAPPPENPPLRLLEVTYHRGLSKDVHYEPLVGPSRLFEFCAKPKSTAPISVRAFEAKTGQALGAPYVWTASPPAPQ